MEATKDFNKLGQETVARKILEAEGKVITSISLATALRRIKKPVVKFSRR